MPYCDQFDTDMCDDYWDRYTQNEGRWRRHQNCTFNKQSGRSNNNMHGNYRNNNCFSRFPSNSNSKIDWSRRTGNRMQYNMNSQRSGRNYDEFMMNGGGGNSGGGNSSGNRRPRVQFLDENPNRMRRAGSLPPRETSSWSNGNDYSMSKPWDEVRRDNYLMNGGFTRSNLQRSESTSHLSKRADVIQRSSPPQSTRDFSVPPKMLNRSVPEILGQSKIKPTNKKTAYRANLLPKKPIIPEVDDDAFWDDEDDEYNEEKIGAQNEEPCVSSEEDQEMPEENKERKIKVEKDGPSSGFNEFDLHNDLKNQAILKTLVYRCYACNILSLSEFDALNHIKTNYHLKALHKVLKELTGIEVANKAELAHAFKLACTDGVTNQTMASDGLIQNSNDEKEDSILKARKRVKSNMSEEDLDFSM
ncbi:uncharacterized protein LOC106662683 isoform X2 [Cimex lectularius]|uniref:Uncharacterized protein n=1 Tax=Cimex lectularius TaxID=79782 RepID=A0A8I6RC22_CIMLE|nr:uncharacterized protein LOC106662683 isoform X2 [Cimex lectularius]